MGADVVHRDTGAGLDVRRGVDDRLEEVVSAGLTAAVLATAAVLPLVPWLLGIDPVHAVLAALHAAVCGAGAGVAVHRRFRPCLLIACVFPYCWLVVPSVFQIDRVQAAWNDPGVTLDFSATMRAQLVLLLGQSAFLVGYLLVTGRRGGESRPWEIDPARQRRMVLVSAGYLVVASLLAVVLLSVAGGVGSLTTSREAVNGTLQGNGLSKDDNVVGSLVRIAPSSFAIAAAVLALWLVPSAPRGSRVRAAAVALAVVAFLLLLVVANPFITPRYFVLTAFGTFGLALFRPRRRRGAFAWLALSVSALLVAYPAANYFRYGDSRSGAEPVLASVDFDGFQQMINTVTFVDARGVDWGHHLLSGVLFFVPRGIWPAKAEPTTLEVAGARGYDFLDLSTPFPAEAYLAFGWVGAVLVLGVLGAVWSRLDRAWIVQSRTAVVAVYLAIAQVGLWRGPFGSLSGTFGFTAGLLVLAVLLTARRRAVPDARPALGNPRSRDASPEPDLTFRA